MRINRYDVPGISCSEYPCSVWGTTPDRRRAVCVFANVSLGDDAAFSLVYILPGSDHAADSCLHCGDVVLRNLDLCVLETAPPDFPDMKDTRKEKWGRLLQPKVRKTFLLLILVFI